MGPHVGKAVLAQDPQVLGYGGLRDPELPPDHVRDRPGGPLAIRQELEDPTADGIPEDIERLHVRQAIRPGLYTSSLIERKRGG